MCTQRPCTKTLGCAALVLALGLFCKPAQGVGVKIGDDKTWAKLGLLLQGWAAFTDEGAPDGESMDTDFYLRRLRLLLWGQLHEKVNFFVETDNPNFGRQGDFSSRMFVQDAWVEFNLLPALQIDVGMLLVPFSHHGMQGAITLHSVDYHSNLIRYPQGSHKVWRDYGVMVRGMLLDDMIEYRLAILNGVHGSADDHRNPYDLPRLAGRLNWNFFEAEGGAGLGGFFYDGLYLKSSDQGVVGTKKILSVGVSVDWQPDLNVELRQISGAVEDRNDYLAVAADVFFDLPLDEEHLLGLAGQINFFYYDHGDRRLYSDGSPHSLYGTDPKYSTSFTGIGIASEIGLRYDAWELVGAIDWFEASEADGDDGDLLSVYGGVNWWWLAHATSIKLQAGATKRDGGDWGLAGHLQAQLLF